MLTRQTMVGRIQLVRWCLLVISVLALLAGLSKAPACAQDEGAWSDPTREVQPYVPPPAWKSVEVGNFYLKKKRYKAALSRFQEAAAVDPYHAPAYLGMGKVYEKIGLRQKALEAYRKYLDLLPSTKEAEEARDVHKAIARLERKLTNSRRRGPAQSPAKAQPSPR